MSSHISKIYQADLSLLTDLYQLTMAYGHWKSGTHEKEAVFHLFYRNNPFQNPYAINAGLDLVIDYLKHFRFKKDDIRYLESLEGSNDRPLFEKGFLRYLKQLRFECSIDAVPEGTVVFPHEPLLRVRGPLLQAQLLETVFLNLINFSTLIATKASRISRAAKNNTVLEFGLRRAQGIDGALTASRSAYIGGVHATSNVLAGKLFDIPVKGTHAHSWVMSFSSEQEAFDKYAGAMPNNSVLLVDTYDTIEGIKNAIKTGKRLKKMGYPLNGIRLDSGNLEDLSKAAREMLDMAGFHNTAIVASNDLDEHAIQELKQNNSPITVWGVGTRLITARGGGALNGVYKMAALKDDLGHWQYKIKLSEDMGKISNPGILQVKRLYNDKGFPIADVIFNEEDFSDKSEIHEMKTGRIFNFESRKETDLLVPVFDKGKLVYKAPDIHEIREYSLKQQALFEHTFAIGYTVGLESRLFNTKQSMIEKRHVPVLV
jgi:nicotinate phosphoribosyltransferase